MLINGIIVAIVLAMVGAAVGYIRKQKKKGVVCIGCPSAGTCGKSKEGKCTCHAE